MQHTITALVENRPGVLARVTGLFARRGFNIESLAVSITEDPTVSRITLVVGGDEKALEQISKQLNKLIDVIKVYDYTDTPSVARAVALPLLGIGIGSVLQFRARRAGSLAIGIALGLLGPINWLLWRVYNRIEDHYGLDSVKAMLLNLALFAALGLAAGAAIRLLS